MSETTRWPRSSAQTARCWRHPRDLPARPPSALHRPAGRTLTVEEMHGVPDDSETESYRVWSHGGRHRARTGLGVRRRKPRVGLGDRRRASPLAVGRRPVDPDRAGVGTTLVVGRALRPVEAIRREVALISGTDLDRRVPVPSNDDEVRRLAVTMNTMLERLRPATSVSSSSSPTRRTNCRARSPRFGPSSKSARTQPAPPIGRNSRHTCLPTSTGWRGSSATSSIWPARISRSPVGRCASGPRRGDRRGSGAHDPPRRRRDRASEVCRRADARRSQRILPGCSVISSTTPWDTPTHQVWVSAAVGRRTCGGRRRGRRAGHSHRPTRACLRAIRPARQLAVTASGGAGLGLAIARGIAVAAWRFGRDRGQSTRAHRGTPRRWGFPIDGRRLG